MEYNARILLNSKLGLQFFNKKLHLLELPYFYKLFLQVMAKYIIGKNENLTKLRQLCYWIVEKR